MEQHELITSMLDQVQHLMNTTYVFPEDKIELLKWDEEQHTWFFPKCYPKNEGSYMEVLTHTIQQIFQDTHVAHEGMLHTFNLENDFMTTIHLTTITDLKSHYEVYTETKVYKPKDRIPVVVSCKLTCASCTENTIEDCRSFAQYLLNQKKLSEDTVNASKQALTKFQVWTSTLIDAHNDLTDTIHLIQREVPNLPEQMRIYNRRLSECSRTLSAILTHIKNDIPIDSGISDCMKID